MLSSDKSLVLIPLCRKGDRVGIERQLEAGAPIGEQDVEGNTPLHVAVEAPKNEIATMQCLFENGANANVANFIGATPLHYVCLRKSNQRGVANILLENGADINAQTLAGKSALHFACENQLPELIEVLLQFSANANLIDSEGNTPVHSTFLREGGRDTVKRQILEHLMAYMASPMGVNNEGLLPVHMACSRGCIRCLQFLIERQVDVTALTARQESALHLACSGGHAEVTQMLIQVVPQCLDAQDFEGNTPLHACALTGNLDCASLLLKVGANVTVKNASNKTAYDLAKLKGTDLNNTHNPELVQALKDAQKSGKCRQS